MKSTLIFVLGLILYAAAAAEDYPIVDATDYKGVIVPADSAARDKFLASAYSGFWTPTAEQIAKAEARITAFLRASAEKYAPRQHKKLKWFRRQYVGYSKGGEKFILCNFLPGVKKGQDPFEGLRQRYNWSRDGGPDHWEIHYRVDKDECERFHVDLGY